MADVATLWAYLQCPLYALTGLYCPLCGSTRAILALLHGDLLLALRCNILTVGFVMWAASVAARRYGGSKASPGNTGDGKWPRLRWAAAVAVLVFTVARNAPGVWWLRP